MEGYTGWETDSRALLNLGARSLDSIPEWMNRFSIEWESIGLVKREGNSLVPIPAAGVVDPLVGRVSGPSRTQGM